MTFRSLVLMLAGLLALGCSRPAEMSQAPARVFAASSLSDVLKEASDAYVAGGGVAPVVNLAASSALARQIEQGAEADLFLSADSDWVDYLKERTLLVQGSERLLAGNDLVLVVPSTAVDAASLSLRTLPDMPGDERLAVADPDGVPAGRYARAAMTSMGVWESLSDRLVLGENVRAALGYVESGEAAAGIVYRTDALAAGDKVRIVEAIDRSLHPPITYWGALVDRPAASTEAKAFLDYLASEAGQAVFARHGFGPPPEPSP